MCHNCDEENLFSPCGCPGCGDCVEPEITVVRRLNKINPCDTILSALNDIVQRPARECISKIFSVNVDGSTVSIIPTNPSNDLEYSNDGVLFQANNVFINQACGVRKYWMRQRSYLACLDAKTVTLTGNCECIPDKKPVTPPVVDCIGGFINIRVDDGCGNLDWEATTTPCNQCIPDMKDVVPAVTECGPNNKKMYFQVDGCGGVNWRLSDENCSQCIKPTLPSSAVVTKATCNQQGQLQSDASFTLGPVIGATKFGVSNGIDYFGPDYSTSTVVPSNNIIKVENLPGNGFDMVYTVRVYNGSNDCYIDKVVTIPGMSCQPTCIFPSGTLFHVNPLCAQGGATQSNGILQLMNMANFTRYQICEGSAVFNCTPNYSNATPASGPGPFIIKTNVGFNANQEYLDYVVRVYNGSAACFTDFPLRFYNPCYTGNPQCTSPQYANPVPTAATCNGSNPNNNASIAISQITNANRYGFSAGTTYSGASYAAATSIGGGSINITNLAGLNTSSNYVIRLYNGSSECFVDVPVIVPGVTCGSPCVTPGFGGKSAQAPTCNGGLQNNDAVISITGITNVTKYGISSGNIYNGPNFDSATNFSSSNLNLNNIPGAATDQPFTIRLFNASGSCFLDINQIVPGNPCVISCVNPTFTISATSPTCNNNETNADGTVAINNILNGNKYQFCLQPTFNCTPNYANSPTISGTGPITVNAAISIPSGEAGVSATVRVYNQSESCYTDHSVVITNECLSCCDMEITSVEVNNT